MTSEADLDADIKALSILSEHTDLYEEFAKLGCVSSLVSLLSHENTDIAIDAIEIINELTDDDVNAEQNEWDALVDALLEADVLNLLYENLNRLNEESESDRAGAYYVMGVIENLASRPSVAEQIGKETEFLNWLQSRLQKKESPVSQNKEYASEILSILLQSSSENRKKMISSDGIDAFLQMLSSYRKKDPAKDSEEDGYVDNLFDCLTCCVDEAEGKAKFLDAEGTELCLIMVREGKMSKPRALCVLDHALGGAGGRECCEKFVEAAGLKTLFSALVKKPDKKSTEHILGIFSSMLRLLPANEGPRIRLLAKFVEKDYQVLERLVQIRRENAARVATADEAIKVERASRSVEEQEELATQWFLQRLDAGFYVLQTVDVILAWLVAEDDGARKRLAALFQEKSEDFSSIKSTLQGMTPVVQCEWMLTFRSDQLDGMTATTEDEDTFTREMLQALIEQLD